MNIDEMSAGREMDCQIALKVMGWSEASWDCEMHEYNGSPHGGANGLLYIIPHYSTDIAAAFEVLEKIKPQLLRIDITLNVGPHLKPYVVLIIGQDGKYWQGEGGTLAAAICRAALKALGVSSL